MNERRRRTMSARFGGHGFFPRARCAALSAGLAVAPACSEPSAHGPGFADLPHVAGVHEQALLDHRGANTFSAAQVRPYVGGGRARGAESAKVMGYLPYWVDDVDLAWDTLDVVAWFSAEIDADGSISNDHGWGGLAYDELLTQARAAGVKVVLCATRFGGDSLHELLPSATSRQRLIDALVTSVVEADGDGIDVDFEGMDAVDRNDFVSFVQDLRAAMDAAQPGLHLSLAMPAIDWQGAYDYDVLAEASDALFIMGYAFSGSWGDPGPNAPLDGSTRWGNHSLTWTVEDYIEYGGQENAHKFLLGLPLYGGQWDAASGAVPGESEGNYDSIVWTEGLALGDAHGKEWDIASSTPYSLWQSGGQWRQAWYEDVDSIALKADLSRPYGFGGFGFWALGYEDGDAELWSTLDQVAESWSPPQGNDDDAVGDDDTPPSGSGAPTAVIDAPHYAFTGTRVTFDAAASSDPDADSLLYAWTPGEGGATLALRDADKSLAWFDADSPGLYRVRLTVSDGTQEATADHEVRVLPAEDSGLAPMSGGEIGVGCAASVGGARGVSVLSFFALFVVVRRSRQPRVR